MNKTLVSLLALALAGPAAVGAESVTGSITLDGRKVVLTHAYAFWSMKEMGMGRVLLSDAPLPAEVLKDYAKLMEHAGQKKLTLVDFHAAPRQAVKVANPTIFSPLLKNGIDQVPADSPGTLTVKSFEGDRLMATWSSGGTKKTIGASVPHSFDVSFDVTFR